MPSIRFQVQVPASPERVFEHVTRFPAAGPPSRRTLEDKYGRLVGQDGQDYTFLDKADENVRWRCTFDPPRHCAMRAPESTWADRSDWFEPSGDGTLWTVAWDTKTRGIRSLIQWMIFQKTGKRQTYEQIVAPVLRHFATEPAATDPSPAATGETDIEAAVEVLPETPAPAEPAPADESAPEPETTDAPAGPERPRRPRSRVRRRRRPSEDGGEGC